MRPALRYYRGAADTSPAFGPTAAIAYPRAAVTEAEFPGSMFRHGR
jgi:hypothetical protein